MSKIHLTIGGGIVLFLVGGISYTLYQKNTDEAPGVGTSESSAQAQDERPYETQVDETGPVTVTITPLELSADNWDFEVTLQTHSVDLDMDILKSIVLRTNESTEIIPEAWDGDPPGGHHRMGIVQFTSASPVPSKFMLLVKDVGGVPLREFAW